MLKFAELVKDVHPGIFVHSIYVEENLDSDQRAGFVSFAVPSPPDGCLNVWSATLQSLETSTINLKELPNNSPPLKN